MTHNTSIDSKQRIKIRQDINKSFRMIKQVMDDIDTNLLADNSTKFTRNLFLALEIIKSFESVFQGITKKGVLNVVDE